jgi:hypothetical protein
MFSVRKFHKKRGPNVSSFIWLVDMQVPFYFSVTGQCLRHCPVPLQDKFFIVTEKLCGKLDFILTF